MGKIVLFCRSEKRVFIPSAIVFYYFGVSLFIPYIRKSVTETQSVSLALCLLCVFSSIMTAQLSQQLNSLSFSLS